MYRLLGVLCVLQALRSSDIFFKQIDIPAFFIEWETFQLAHMRKEAQELGEIFLKQGFLPFDPTSMNRLPPNSQSAGKWSYDILFLKSYYSDLLK